MKKVFGIAALVLLMVCMSQTAGAVTVDYNAIDLSNGLWQFDYTIYNDSQMEISAIDIFFGFDGGPYSNLELLPASWLGDIGWGAGLFPQFDFAGILEPWILSAWVEDGDLLSYGGSLGVLSVQFDWAGNEAPGMQEFRLWDAIGSELVDYDRFTRPVENAPPVPEPGTMALLGTGLAGLFAYYRKNKARKNR